MHNILALALALTLAACGSASPTPSDTAMAPPSLDVSASRAAASLSPPLTTFFESPFWFGRSDHSPFGPMPYGLTARQDGDRLVLRGDVPDGLGMPPGSYQQFTFTPGQRVELHFETSLTGEIVKGTMHEVSRTSTSLTFCMSPDKGDCDEMTVVLALVEQGILFETRREKGPHHRVVLAAARP